MGEVDWTLFFLSCYRSAALLGVREKRNFKQMSIFMCQWQSWYVKSSQHIFLKVDLLCAKNFIRKEVPLPLSQHYTKASTFYWSWLGFILFLSYLRGQYVVSCPVWHLFAVKLQVAEILTTIAIYEMHYLQNIDWLLMLNPNTRFHWVQQWSFIDASESQLCYLSFIIPWKQFTLNPTFKFQLGNIVSSLTPAETCANLVINYFSYASKMLSPRW